MRGKDYMTPVTQESLARVSSGKDRDEVSQRRKREGQRSTKGRDACRLIRSRDRPAPSGRRGCEAEERKRGARQHTSEMGTKGDSQDIKDTLLGCLALGYIHRVEYSPANHMIPKTEHCSTTLQ
jgi:hypothetical protein